MTLLNFQTVDLAPAAQDFLGEVMKGLSQPVKTLAPKYFYDDHGMELFEKICELPEYYVTRTELSIMDELSSFALPASGQLAVIELGGASSFKFRRLQRSLADIGMYIPVDICRQALFHEAQKLARDCPELKVMALCADYQQLESFPWETYTAGFTPVVYFPGSTIGNLTPSEAKSLLKMLRRIVGPNGYILLGCDLVKPLTTLIPAYDDAQGVTAEFNLNLLRRINRELGANFDLHQFRHEIRYNAAESKIEMHLVSLASQTVQLAGTTLQFAKGESIHTEDSRKFTRQAIEKLAAESGFCIDQWWTDSRDYFAITLLGSVTSANILSMRANQSADSSHPFLRRAEHSPTSSAARA